MQALRANFRFRLPLSGMPCVSREHPVEQRFRIAGEADATADFRRNDVTFSVDGEQDDPSLKAAVASAGYEPGESSLSCAQTRTRYPGLNRSRLSGVRVD